MQPGSRPVNTAKSLWHTRRKRGRLIVRNLPFKVTEEKLREHFSPYGDVQEVTLLKKPDGKLVGCGFVEFKSKEEAANAISATSGKPILKRPVIVDWAVPKKLFQINKRFKKEEEVEVKQEEGDSDQEEESGSVKQEDSDSEDSASVKSEGSEGDEAGADESAEEEEEEEEEARERRPPPPCDLQEGCTVFLKGVPFSATQEQLRASMAQFGAVHYALICMDPVTEHSRGTAFVKFKSKDSAEACIKAPSSQLVLGNGVLEPRAALDKKQLQKQHDTKKSENKSKDGRNLYLVKEGVVQAGTEAAKGLSTQDMGKRLQLEQWKTQMLRNLSMVVSRTRLVVHNLPPTLGDEGLRRIVKKHAPPNARLTEVRVMRDLRKVDSTGQGVSKGFAFLSFAFHEDALITLRNMNNNPSIFTKHQRPIVGFSIENKSILNAKKRRLEMSRHKNPYFERDKKGKKPPAGTSRTPSDEVGEPAGGSFKGMEAHTGQTVRLPTRGTLRAQASTHRQNVAQERKHKKLQRKSVQDKTDRMKQRRETKSTAQPKKKGKKNSDDKDEKAFNSLVNKYREKLESAVDIKKWYE